MKKENKFIIILIVILAIILCAGLFINNDDKEETSTKLTNDADIILSNAQSESSKVKSEDKKEFQEINTNEYMELYRGQNKTIVLIARPTCHYCQIAEPILGKIAKDYDLDIKYLNTDNLTRDDYETLIGSNEFLNNGLGTPILLIVNEEKIINAVDGLTDTAHYIDFFKKNGFIE